MVKRPLEGGLTYWSSVRRDYNSAWAAVRPVRALWMQLFARKEHLVDFPRNVTHTFATTLLKHNGFPLHVRSIGDDAKRVLSKQLLRSEIGVLGVGTLWGKLLRTLSHYNLFSQFYSFIYLFIFFRT